jgi:hypothetical protein
MQKKFSVPLTSESVTSGQAGGVFRQLFLQCACTEISLSSRKYPCQENIHVCKHICYLLKEMFLRARIFTGMDAKFHRGYENYAVFLVKKTSPCLQLHGQFFADKK